MLTYNEIVDNLEKVNPEKIASDVQKQVDDATEEIMSEVDEKLANVKKMYKHHVIIHGDLSGGKINYVCLEIINSDNTQFTIQTLKTYIADNYNGSVYFGGIPAIGGITSGGKLIIVEYLAILSSALHAYLIDESSTTLVDMNINNWIMTSDTVKEL